jgi:hypothetical protein
MITVTIVNLAGSTGLKLEVDGHGFDFFAKEKDILALAEKCKEVQVLDRRDEDISLVDPVVFPKTK